MYHHLKLYDQKLAANFKLFYDRSIEYGGHPNPYGVLTAIKMETKDDQLTSITTLALADDPTITMFAMKNVAQVGLTSLCIFKNYVQGKVRDARHPSRNGCVEKDWTLSEGDSEVRHWHTLPNDRQSAPSGTA